MGNADPIKQRNKKMTDEQRIWCHAIIHSSAVATGAGNTVPVPVLGLAADTAALVGMAIGLAAVFGQSIPESAAKVMAVDALKKTLLKQPVKVIAKKLSKIVPFFASVSAATVSVGLVEAAEWTLAGDFEHMAQKEAA